MDELLRCCEDTAGVSARQPESRDAQIEVFGVKPDTRLGSQNRSNFFSGQS